MKKIYTPIIAIIFALTATAQSGDLKGPEYKNRKPWKDPKPTKTMFIQDKEVVKGPEAKNTRPFEQDAEKIAIKTEKRLETVKGPEAKNRKPWDKN